MALTIENESQLAALLSKIADDQKGHGVGAANIQQKLSELSNPQIASATVNSPVTKASNKALAQAISEAIISKMNPVLSAIIKQNSESMQKILIENKREEGYLNKSIEEVDDKLNTTNELLTEIKNGLKLGVSNNNSPGTGSTPWAALAALPLALGAFTRKIEDLFKDKGKGEDGKGKGEDGKGKGEDGKGKGEDGKGKVNELDELKRLRNESEKPAADTKAERLRRAAEGGKESRYTLEEAERLRRAAEGGKEPRYTLEDAAEIEKLKRKAAYEPKTNADGKLVDKNGNPLNKGAAEAVENRINEANAAKAELKLLERKSYSSGGPVMNNGFREISPNPLKALEQVLQKANDGAKIIRWPAGELVLEFGGKVFMYAAVMALIYEAAKQIWALDRDISTTRVKTGHNRAGDIFENVSSGKRLNRMTDEQWIQEATAIILALTAEFGVAVVLGELSSILAAAAATATTGIGGFPAAVVGGFVGFFAGMAVDYLYGEAVQDFVKDLVRWIFKKSNKDDKTNPLANSLKRLKQKSKDAQRVDREGGEHKASTIQTPQDLATIFAAAGIDTSSIVISQPAVTPAMGNATAGWGAGVGGGSPTTTRSKVPYTPPGSMKETVPFSQEGMVGGGQFKDLKEKISKEEVTAYLKSKGLDDEHIIGILTNIQAESEFAPGRYGVLPGENGPTGGLFQHHDDPTKKLRRFSDMVAYAGPDWQKNWKKQIDFALSESSSRLYLNKKFNSGEEASSWWTTEWERPANKFVQAELRARNAANFKKMVSQQAAEVPSIPQTGAALGAASTPPAPVTTPPSPDVPFGTFGQNNTGPQKNTTTASNEKTSDPKNAGLVAPSHAELAMHFEGLIAA